MKSIPLEIKRIRKRIGWTQNDLAKYLGKSPASVGHYETGLNMPSAKTWIKIQKLGRLTKEAE